MLLLVVYLEGELSSGNLLPFPKDDESFSCSSSRILVSNSLPSKDSLEVCLHISVTIPRKRAHDENSSNEKNLLLRFPSFSVDELPSVNSLSFNDSL